MDVVLDKYMKHPKFRGVRNILEAEEDNWLSQESVHRGLGITAVTINNNIIKLITVLK